MKKHNHKEKCPVCGKYLKDLSGVVQHMGIKHTTLRERVIDNNKGYCGDIDSVDVGDLLTL